MKHHLATQPYKNLRLVLKSLQNTIKAPFDRKPFHKFHFYPAKPLSLGKLIGPLFGPIPFIGWAGRRHGSRASDRPLGETNLTIRLGAELSTDLRVLILVLYRC